MEDLDLRPLHMGTVADFAPETRYLLPEVALSAFSPGMPHFNGKSSTLDSKVNPLSKGIFCPKAFSP